MALASQSSRPDRPFRSTRSGRSLVGARGLVALCAAGAAFGGSWWLMRSDSGADGALAPKTSGTVLAAAGTSGLAAIPPELTATPIAPQPTVLDNALADAANAARAESQLSRAEAQAPPVAEPASPQGVPASVPANAPASPTSPTSPVGNGFDGKPLEARPQGAAPQPLNGGGIADGLALAATDPVKGRRALSEALLSGALSQMESKQASDALNKIAAQLVFTPVYNASDPYFFQYTVQAGDSLEKIVRRHKIGCDWRLVARINNIKRPEAIRVGQRLKLPKGPFSAVVTKRDYRVDLVMGAGSDRVVMASIPCGLGSANGTPTGRFRVRPGSKLLNPEWTHPVTGQHFKSDDPMNPIGEHWLGLEGIETANASLAGYGIHGTIEPESVGRDMSLGCVRLIADDVAIVWETLGDGCEVEIR